MARGFLGPRSLPGRWTDSKGKPLWSEHPWPGMVLRRAELDESGNVVKETISRVPMDRSLEAAMAWAEKEYGP